MFHMMGIIDHFEIQALSRTSYAKFRNFQPMKGLSMPWKWKKKFKNFQGLLRKSGHSAFSGEFQTKHLGWQFLAMIYRPSVFRYLDRLSDWNCLRDPECDTETFRLMSKCVYFSSRPTCVPSTLEALPRLHWYAVYIYALLTYFRRAVTYRPTYHSAYRPKSNGFISRRHLFFSNSLKTDIGLIVGPGRRVPKSHSSCSSSCCCYKFSKDP